MIFHYVFGKLGENFILINQFTDDKQAQLVLNRIIELFGEGKIVEKIINSELDELCTVCFSCNWIPHFKTIQYTLGENGEKIFHYECGKCHTEQKMIIVKNKSISDFVSD